MRCTVTWDPGALNELARIWIAAPNKQAVTDASNKIERLLNTSSSDVGDPHGDYRRLVERPLEVVYRVLPEDRLVQVIQVIRTPGS